MSFRTETSTHLCRIAGVALLGAWLAPAGWAQIVVPTTINGTVPSSATSSYILNNSVTCPTPTFNIIGFGGDVDGSASDPNGLTRTQNANVNNWGVALGVSVPLAGQSLNDFCRKFAKAQSDFQQQRTLNLERNSKIALLEQCLYIQNSLGIRISPNASAFAPNGSLAPFAECLELSDVLDPAKRRPAINLAPAPKAPTESASPSATPVTITQ